MLGYGNFVQRCISFDSYIKPQLVRVLNVQYLVVYLLIPTSNHNDATDFPIPEFDSIGMQTQYRCELSAYLLGSCPQIYDSSNSSKSQGVLDMSVTYGYAPRYAELKSSCDYLEGGFMGAYSSWVTGYDNSFLRNWRLNGSANSGSELPGIDDLFKCRPSLLYPIFVNQWSGTVNDDKFLIGSVNTCVAVRPFSMYGLPYSK